ncbi:nickel transporter permease [Bacillus sp. FJAT-44742]|uniref:nickel transporter permease n=1 Tax=Bacillus sp. FJAT-44742 TaxID=2014005 RepID=UPI000C244E24|nr:nickel transporter permease [Bacillus sp. FJAT-44742]
MIHKVSKEKLFCFGIVLLLGFGVISLIGSYGLQNESIHPNMAERLLPPSLQYPLGTDHLGRCIFSRIAEGGLLTLQVSSFSLLVTLLIGVPLGVLSGYFGGKIDTIIMRIVDGFAAFPDFILAIVIAGLLGPSLQNVLIAIVAVKWINYARVTRSITIAEKEKEYILSAVSIGCTNRRIIWKHLFPTVLPHTLTIASLDMGKIILIIASLSYLGLGAQPPIPEWGAMLNDSRAFFQTHPFLMIIPGVMILLTVLSFNLIGEGLREVLNVKKVTR